MNAHKKRWWRRKKWLGNNLKALTHHSKTMKLKQQNGRKYEPDRMFMFHWMWPLGVYHMERAPRRTYEPKFKYIQKQKQENKRQNKKQNKAKYSVFEMKEEAEAKEMEWRKNWWWPSCRSSQNVVHTWMSMWLRTCVRVYVYISVCNVVTVLFNKRTHDIFSFTLFSRHSRLPISCCKRHTHIHEHTQISQSRNEFVFFFFGRSLKSNVSINLTVKFLFIWMLFFFVVSVVVCVWTLFIRNGIFSFSSTLSLLLEIMS